MIVKVNIHRLNELDKLFKCLDTEVNQEILNFKSSIEQYIYEEHKRDNIPENFIGDLLIHFVDKYNNDVKEIDDIFGFMWTYWDEDFVDINYMFQEDFENVLKIKFNKTKQNYV